MNVEVDENLDFQPFSLSLNLGPLYFRDFFLFFFKYYLRGLEIGFKEKRYKTCLHRGTQESKF